MEAQMMFKASPDPHKAINPESFRGDLTAACSSCNAMDGYTATGEFSNEAKH